MAATKRLNKAQKAENESASEVQEKLGGKEYERELARLHGELVKLQLWVVAKGANHPGAVGAFDRSPFSTGCL
jgi:polyphosphate kinase